MATHTRKRSSRLLSLLLVLVMTISILAGCAGDSGTPGGPGDTPRGADSSELVEITWFQQLRGINPDTDRIVRAVEEEMNIKFNFIAAPDGDDEQRQKLSLMISTGEHLDLATMLFGINPLVVQWAKDDVLYSFDEIIAQGDYPLMKSMIEAELYNWVKVDGETYFQVLPLAPGNRGYVIRKDWLDRLGMEIPTTLDEYYDVIKAFATNDMNGNGQNDTYGFFVAENIGSNAFAYIARAFIPCGVWGGDWVELPDGTVTQFVATDEAREAFRFIKKCYDEELFNRSFVNERDAEGKLDDLMVQGRLGIMDITGVNSIEQRFADAGVEYELEYLPPLNMLDGSQGTLQHTTGGWGHHLIPKTCKDPQRVMDMLEWCMTEKGREITMYGIDGIHFDGYTVMDNGIKAYNTNREEMEKDWNTTDYGLSHPLSWGAFNHDGGYIPVVENGYNFDQALVEQEQWMAAENVGGKFDLLKQMNAPYAYMLPFQATVDEDLLVEQRLKDIEIEGRTKAIVEPAEDFDANWDAMLEEWMAAGGAELLARGKAAWEAMK